jgi:glycosyltransferase involved in cell wall biosynthesis
MAFVDQLSVPGFEYMKVQLLPRKDDNGQWKYGNEIRHDDTKLNFFFRNLNTLARMQQLSVVIITFNEESNIARCIDSVRKVADEVVVLDSFSTDATVAIARQKGAVVHAQAFAGYIEQKNRALQLASHSFVLSMDADEAIDERLEASILQVKGMPEALDWCYTMNRCTNYCGKFIRHGSWYPDRKLRLFDKSKAAWAGRTIHEKVATVLPSTHLKGDILHYSYDTLEEHVLQNNRFSTLSAEAYREMGKKSDWAKMLLRPGWAFFQGYILRLGFLDGFYGLVIAGSVAHLTFMKYYKLYALERGIPVRSTPFR